MDEINKLHQEILSIFKCFKQICQKYKLTYYAIGGTCIGAIRHNGFIPWDDDLDVAMPVEDYLKFREIAKIELTGKYRLYDYMDEKLNKFNFLKIHDTSTTFVEKEEYQYPKKYKGVYIDIMPIAGIPKNIFLQKLYLNKLLFLTKLDLNNRTPLKYKKTIISKIQWIMIKPLISFKYDFYTKIIEKNWKKYKINDKNDILFAWRIPLNKPYSNVFKYEYFSNTKEVNFEDTTIDVPIKYDEYLKKDFGNYMELPPIEKRITHKPAILDLNKSFIYYAEKRRKELTDE